MDTYTFPATIGKAQRISIPKEYKDLIIEGEKVVVTIVKLKEETNNDE